MQDKIDHKYQDFVGETTEDQAAYWVYRLEDKDCSARDQAAFLQWHAKRENQEAFAREKDLYEKLDLLQDLKSSVTVDSQPGRMAAASRSSGTNANKGALKPRKTIRNADRSDYKRKLIFGSAAVFAAAASVLLALFVLPQDASLRTTHVGEIASIQLDDDSEMILDTDSAARIEYTKATRKIVMESGRAFFKVAKDASRPFIVEAGARAVTAIGTEFTVYYTASASRVSLKEGIVEVDTGIKDDSVSLKPGQAWTSSGDTSGKVLEIASSEEEFSWVDGTLYFESATLDEVVASINRYSKTQVILANDELRHKTISGRYTVGELKPFLALLNSMYDFTQHYDQNGNVTIGKTKD